MKPFPLIEIPRVSAGEMEKKLQPVLVLKAEQLNGWVEDNKNARRKNSVKSYGRMGGGGGFFNKEPPLWFWKRLAEKNYLYG